jgi:alpha-L-fucosidase
LGDFDTAENHMGAFQIDRPWESCIKIGGPWSWGGPQRSSQGFETCLRTLIRCTGHGGNLALNTGPSPLGEIHPDDVNVYLGIGQWLKRYGQSLYGTRAGPYKPGPWGVCTHTEDTIYLHVMQNWPDGALRLPPLQEKVISASTLTGGEPSVAQDTSGVCIRLGSEHHNPLDTIIALKMAGDVTRLSPIETHPGPSLTVGKRTTASSENGERKAAAVVASDMTVFEEGAYSKSFWQPGRNDTSPWLAIQLGVPVKFDRILIREKGNHITAFRIDSRIGNDWVLCHRGRKLGDLSLCVAPKQASEIRLVIEKWQGLPGILTFDVFQGSACRK